MLKQKDVVIKKFDEINTRAAGMKFEIEQNELAKLNLKSKVHSFVGETGRDLLRYIRQDENNKQDDNQNPEVEIELIDNNNQREIPLSMTNPSKKQEAKQEVLLVRPSNFHAACDEVISRSCVHVVRGSHIKRETIHESCNVSPFNDVIL